MSRDQLAGNPNVERHAVRDALAKLSIAAVLAAPAYFVIGEVGSHLWRWYAVPSPIGAPPLSRAQFVGIWLCVRILRDGPPTTKEEDETPAQYFAEIVASAFARPLTLLLIGWCVHVAWP